ncbi:MAG: nicotinate-nucleotide--dimethylbenzimidazole phosphoribosyltransferase [Candidatus Abyssubacteria bacterium]
MKLIDETVKAISPQDGTARAKAKNRLDQLTMPHWALGKLMDLALELAGMTGSLRPAVERRAVVTMAADHGVAAESVSKYPREVTAQMVHNFVNGGAGINALARAAGARVIVVDMGVAADLAPLARAGKIISKRVAAGTRNMALGPAMTREEAIRSVEAGIEVARELAEFDVLGTGDMGIGNTTAASAVVAAITGAPPGEVTGRGTGIDEVQFQRKVQVIERALALNRPDSSDGLDVLAKVGGFEIGGIAGLILGAAALRKPVLLDGFPASAGALIAQSLAPLSVEYMIASHLSVEKGHAAMHSWLGKNPLLDLNLRLGEGTGAALAMNLVDAAVRILTEVATFDEASVSKAET